MGMEAVLAFGMLIATGIALMSGFPVAFTLAGVALFFAGLGLALGHVPLIDNLPGRIFGSAMTNDTLIAVPLFVFMGVMLERSRIAETLLDCLSRLMGGLQGGLALAVVTVGALLAASTGIVGATVVTMGLISLPTMLRAGYSPAVASGTICASGTLGQIIPPSIVLVILGDQISSANQEAQSLLQQAAWANNDFSFSPTAVSVGDLFAGALLPGLVLVGLFALYLIFLGKLSPASMPRRQSSQPVTGQEILTAVLPPLLLILAVLGSILMGIAPPGEAAAIGAAGATLLAARSLPNATEPQTDPFPLSAALLAGFVGGGILGAIVSVETDWFSSLPLAMAFGGSGICWILHRFGLPPLLTRKTEWALTATGPALIGLLVLAQLVDLRLTRSDIPVLDKVGIALAFFLTFLLAWGLWAALFRTWRAGILSAVNSRTMEITAMIFTILIGAALFSLVFRGLGGDEVIADLLKDLPGGSFTALLAVMVVMFVLGFFLDFIEIALVVVPIVAPILLASGEISPVWLGVLMAMNLQTSFLTPPFGFALFYLRGVAPDSLRTLNIYRGVIPFIALQGIAIALVWSFPGLSEWLPRVIFG